MKKYTILGHVFELDTHAHAFLTRYVERIETIAQEQHISRDILEDIKYRIIEKLYSYHTPITEAQVMNLAHTIGEPEDIFETQTDENSDSDKTSRLQSRIGRQKPIVWGVCYWIAKSLNISVIIVRVVMIIGIFLGGTSVWLYPLLALFAPYKDKKSTSGSLGNIFFEIIRAVFWIMMIGGLWTIMMAALAGTIIVVFAPLISNQSLLAIVPTYMYPITIASIIAVIVLLVGACGALFKKTWVTKTFALIAVAVGLIGVISAAGTIYQKGMAVVSNGTENSIQSISGSLNSSDSMIINLSGNNKNFSWFEEELDTNFSSIKLVAVSGDTFSAQVETNLRIINQEDKELITSSLLPVDLTVSGNSLNIVFPDKLFSQKVPFSFTSRKLIISVPESKKVVFNNNTQARLYTDNYREETVGTGTQAVSCTDENEFIYHAESGNWRCTHTTSTPINLVNEDMNDDRDDDSLDDQNSEESLKFIYMGLEVGDAEDYARDHHQIFRIVSRNGQSLPVTEDYRPGRINATIYKGIVTDITIE